MVPGDGAVVARLQGKDWHKRVVGFSLLVPLPSLLLIIFTISPDQRSSTTKHFKSNTSKPTSRLSSLSPTTSVSMKFTTAAVFGLAAVASASPAERLAARNCGAPSTYRCAADKSTMEVCDWDGNWKPLVPGCPAGTACSDNPFGNNIPYCVNVPVGGGGPVGGSCTVASQYSCFVNAQGKPGIQICDLSYTLQTVGLCPNSCGYISGIPYCF